MSDEAAVKTTEVTGDFEDRTLPCKVIYTASILNDINSILQLKSDR